MIWLAITGFPTIYSVHFFAFPEREVMRPWSILTMTIRPKGSAIFAIAVSTSGQPAFFSHSGAPATGSHFPSDASNAGMSRSYGSPVATLTCEIEKLVDDGEI